jgi:hypothetical protein
LMIFCQSLGRFGISRSSSAKATIACPNRRSTESRWATVGYWSPELPLNGGFQEQPPNPLTSSPGRGLAKTRMSAVRPRLAEADGAQHVRYLVWGQGLGRSEVNPELV